MHDLYVKYIRFLAKEPELEKLDEDALHRIYAVLSGHMDPLYPVPPIQWVDGISCRMAMRDMDNLRCNIVLDVPDGYDPPGHETLISHIMEAFHLQGTPVLAYDENRKPTHLSTYRADDPCIPLRKISPQTARMLNLQAEGLSQKAIADAAGLSVSTVRILLHSAHRKAPRYGYWQIWPENVPMPYPEETYAKKQPIRKRGNNT